MNVVNRSVLVVKPKQAYINWANQLDGPQITPDNLKDATVFLAPDVEGPDAEESLIKRYYKSIFEHELWAWITDEKDWPPNRDLPTFYEWFHTEFHTMVVDLSNNTLESEPLRNGGTWA
jgi:hypothetical protein